MNAVNTNPQKKNILPQFGYTDDETSCAIWQSHETVNLKVNLLQFEMNFQRFRCVFNKLVTRECVSSRVQCTENLNSSKLIRLFKSKQYKRFFIISKFWPTRSHTFTVKFTKKNYCFDDLRQIYKSISDPRKCLQKKRAVMLTKKTTCLENVLTWK